MTRRFSLLVDDRPETLLRVTGLCLRRRADVVALHYGRSRGGRAGYARLDLELTVDERHGRGLAERLGALVEVRDVAELRAYTG
jgi:acetolactate synthase regulatory subunit